MSAERLNRYRFARPAHWDSCLLAQVDQSSQRKSGAIGPLPSYDLPGELYQSDVARAPAITRARDIVWLDQRRHVNRVTAGLEEHLDFPAPVGMDQATRIVTTAGGLWIGDPPNTLQRFDEETFTRMLTVDVPEGRVIDIARGGRDSLAVLIVRNERTYAIHVDRGGRILGRAMELRGVHNPAAFVYLRRARRYVVLANDARQRLHWFSAKGGAPLVTKLVAAVRPCFTADCIGTDGNDRVFVAGTEGNERVFVAEDEGKTTERSSFVMVFDGDGAALAELPLDPQDAPATGVAASRDRLLVAGQRGLRQFSASQRAPSGGGLVGCELMTPVLFSPDREDRRRWLRIEAEATLPAGSSLAISWIATDDDATRDRLDELAHKASITAAQRIAAIRSDPDVTTGHAIYHGSVEVDAPTERLTAKLFDVHARYLWVHVALTTVGGGQLPRLKSIDVLYPGRTLMENLPGIYQREESRPDSFLRSLVGVLETTTQGLDARIASLGQLLTPAIAGEEWLNFIATWLGVPWDDALPEEPKREILKRASDLAKWRGTRKGLETLLECLMGSSPRRFRVIDATADYGVAVVGSPAHPASALPALLAGRPRWGARLDATAVVGFTRLPCQGQSDDGLRCLTGKIRVTVAANGRQRQAWEPWLSAMLNEMVPLGARLELVWIAPRALRSNRLDGMLSLEGEPAPHLGDDAITGCARLPDHKLILSTGSPIIGVPLR